MFGRKRGFKDSSNTMVLTTKNVVERRDAILFVSHDADDGMWQFHSGTDVDMDNAMLVALEEIVQIDPSVTRIADLPLGWVAWRDDVDGFWRRKKEES